MNRITNLGLIFTSPGTAARSIAEDPHWLLPLIVVLVVAFVFGFVTYKFQAEQQREFLEKIKEERGVDMDIDARLAPTTTRRVTSGLQSAAAIGIMFILIPALVLNGFAKITGGESSFRRMFALLSFAGLITALSLLVKLPLVLAKQSIDVRTSAAMFAPSVGLQSPLYAFLNAFDVFAIWELVAVCIGFSVLSGLAVKKSAAIVVGLWGLGVAILVGIAVITSSLMGMA